MSEFGAIFERIFKESPDVVWIASSSLDRLVFINATIEEWLAIDRQDLLSDPRLHIAAVHHEDRDARQEFFDELASQTDNPVSESKRMRFRVWDANGSLRYLEDVVHPITDSSNAVDYWVGIIRDVTNTESYVETLETQSTQYRLLNQIIRHDIRNEMNLGIDLLRALSHDLDSPSEHIEPLRAVFDRIVELTETSRDMTDVIAEFAGNPATVPLHSCIQREIANLSMTNESVTVAIDGEIPDVSVRSTELLPAVFRNLFSNVVQHSDTETPEITISATRSPNRVVIHVADNGPGIADEHKERIFESGETLQGSGTGFGLALVKTLLAQHDGGIYVMDNEPTGAVFSVTLPLATDQ